MRLTTKAFTNGVSRRIVLLFFSAAILPLLVLAGLTLYQIRENQLEHHSQQLRLSAKSIGMGIFERLQYAKEQLQFIATTLAVDNNHDIGEYLYRKDPHQIDRIESLFTLSPHNGLQILYGRLSLDGKDLLQNIHDQRIPGKTMLLATSNGKEHQGLDLHIFIPLHKDRKTGELLGAKLNTRTLFDKDQADTQGQVICILTDSGTPLYCNKQQDISWIAKIVERAKKNYSGYFLFHEPRQEKLITAYWSIFLKPHYQVDKWSVAVAFPYLKQMGPVKTFEDVFLRVGVVTLVLVLLLSISSIRRIMFPLEQLLSGTRQLSRGAFKTRVSVKTKDEFQELGNAFNDMAEKLGDHFHQQNMLINFSYRIQHTDEIKTALQITYQALLPFIHNQRYELIQIEIRPGFYEMTCIYRNDNAIVDRSMLHTAPFEELPTLLWKGKVENANQFLPILDYTTSSPDAEVTLLPALHKGRIIAYLVIHNQGMEENEKEVLFLLTQFCDILASALSNISLRRQLQYQADHDSLTDLPNRKVIKIETEKALKLAGTMQHEFAIMIMDIDRFKIINDSMGHIAGDDLLKQLAGRLRQFTSRRDLISRFAGDEFVFLFTVERGSIRNTLPEIITRLDRVFIDPYVLGKRNIRISASKGIAVYPDDGETFIDLLKNADAAMYQAKRSKSGSYTFFSKTLQESLSDEMEIEQDLIGALTEQQFELYYQPSIHLPSGRVVGAEALLRWHRPGCGLVTPGVFIKLAEETGLIEPIGNWAMKHACEAYLRWRQQGISITYISVNVSSVQLKSPEFVETVRDTLAVTGMEPSALELEITETAFIEDFQTSLEKLTALRKLGVKIAVDDFGTGYASLKYLKQLPADRLKIDRLFIKGLPENPNDAAIISSLVTLTGKLKLDLIAEGIETNAQRDHLIHAGVNMAQGFLMSPPLPNEAFKSYCLRNKQQQASASLPEKIAIETP
ncbi:MAG: EAL domain-containing protein [Candidatus Thiodiazotropha sp. (ex Epidulcina cf. delphinae)]|nr:EAL domain-containing protein [Candidatus Thiodiazotropha sp. (ex Epidulcina cf. delphinae)]